MNSHPSLQACPVVLSFQAQRVLRALFELSRAVREIEVGLLARELGLLPVRAGQSLLELERRGLVRLACLRLTMPGLLCATRLAPLSQGEHVASESSVVVPMEAARVALARQRSVVRAPRGNQRGGQRSAAGSARRPRGQRAGM